MSRTAARLAALFLTVCVVFGTAADPVSGYWHRRFNADSIDVKEVQGLTQHIQDGKLHLHLREFLELMLKNSPDVQLARLDVYTAATQIMAAKAPFDPTLGLGFTAERSISPVLFSSGISTGTTSTGVSGQGGIGTVGGVAGTQVTLPQTINSLSQNSSITYNQVLPTGQTLGTSFYSYRSSGDSYSSPLTYGILNFSFTQSLLQNRTGLQYRGPVTVAKTQLLITSEQSEGVIAQAVATAAVQYWEAVSARDNIRIQQLTVDLANKSYERDKLALQLGALARLDIFQSETQVAERKRDLVQAEYTYKTQLDGLRRLIGADLTPELRNTELVLDDDASALPAKSSILPFETSLTKALQDRPEVKAAGQAISVDKLNERIARDGLQPKLDLTALGGATGPGLNQVGAGSSLGLPATPYPGIGETLRQVIAFDYPSYGFSIQMTFPFRNSTAKANLANTLVQKAKDEYTKRQTQEQITLQVRQAMDSIELADASIGAAIEARDLAQKNVQAEQQKYELGSITAFELLDSQSRLASSESALSNAYVTYQEANVNYRRATWTLLDGLGMVVEIPKTR
jgi:outer membrane protein TolC